MVFPASLLTESWPCAGLLLSRGCPHMLSLATFSGLAPHHIPAQPLAPRNRPWSSPSATPSWRAPHLLQSAANLISQAPHHILTKTLLSLSCPMLRRPSPCPLSSRSLFPTMLKAAQGYRHRSCLPRGCGCHCLRLDQIFRSLFTRIMTSYRTNDSTPCL